VYQTAIFLAIISKDYMKPTQIARYAESLKDGIGIAIPSNARINLNPIRDLVK